MATQDPTFDIQKINKVSQLVSETLRLEKERTGENFNMFELLAGISQASYNLLLYQSGLAKEQIDPVVNEVQMVGEELLKKFDALRIEHNTMPITDLLSLNYTATLLSEFYYRQSTTENGQDVAVDSKQTH